jgi:hypothetical protein
LLNNVNVCMKFSNNISKWKVTIATILNTPTQTKTLKYPKFYFIFDLFLNSNLATSIWMRVRITCIAKMQKLHAGAGVHGEYNFEVKLVQLITVPSLWNCKPRLYLRRIPNALKQLYQSDLGTFELLRHISILNYVEFVFWDITLCNPLKINQSSGGTCRLHFQGIIRQTRNQY